MARSPFLWQGLTCEEVRVRLFCAPRAVSVDAHHCDNKGFCIFIPGLFFYFSSPGGLRGLASTRGGLKRVYFCVLYIMPHRCEYKYTKCMLWCLEPSMTLLPTDLTLRGVSFVFFRTCSGKKMSALGRLYMLFIVRCVQLLP